MIINGECCLLKAQRHNSIIRRTVCSSRGYATTCLVHDPTSLVYTLCSLFESDDRRVTSPHPPPGSDGPLTPLYGSVPATNRLRLILPYLICWRGGGAWTITRNNETKPPKRKHRNESAETKAPKRKRRNKSAVTKPLKRNHRNQSAETSETIKIVIK